MPQKNQTRRKNAALPKVGLPLLEQQEADGVLTVEAVAETAMRLLDAKIGIPAARRSIASALSSPFTHNSRIGSGRHDLSVKGTRVHLRAGRNASPVPPNTWGFSADGDVVLDAVYNAAHDTLARILLRPWRCANMRSSIAPLDSLLNQSPPYDIIRDPKAWPPGSELQAIAARLQHEPIWQEIRRSRKTAVPRSLSAYAGAPMVHFPLPRKREDVDTPPDYLLLCVLPPNAALRVAANAWRKIFPLELPVGSLHHLLQSLTNLLDKLGKPGGISEHGLHVKDSPAGGKHDAEIGGDATDTGDESRDSPAEKKQDANIEQEIRQIVERLRETKTIDEAESLLEALIPLLQKRKETALVSDIQQVIRHLRGLHRPVTRRVRILNTPAAANNLGSMLRKQDLVQMIETRLPRIGAWQPEHPLSFGDGPDLRRALAAYAALLRDGRKGNLSYRKRQDLIFSDILDAAFAPLCAALDAGRRPTDLPPGSLDVLGCLMREQPPDLSDLEAAADSFATFVLSRIDGSAVGEAAQTVASDLRLAALEMLDDLFYRQARRMA